VPAEAEAEAEAEVNDIADTAASPPSPKALSGKRYEYKEALDRMDVPGMRFGLTRGKCGSQCGEIWMAASRGSGRQAVV